MHWSLASRSRLRRFMNMYGASSLSHSIRTGSPRTNLLATSASSDEYAASTACSGVREAGSSFSVMLILIAVNSKGLLTHSLAQRVPPARCFDTAQREPVEHRATNVG